MPQETKECECGCGEKIPLLNDRGQERRFKHGHNGVKDPSLQTINGRKYGYTTCYICRTKFQRRADQINRHGLRNFCSRECYGQYTKQIATGKPLPKLRKGNDKTCQICGKQFYAQRSRKEKGYAKFCSTECRDRYQKQQWAIGNPNPNLISSTKDHTGENNPNYKHGKRIGGKLSKEQKELRTRLLERCQDKCEFCLTYPPILHKHRIVYGSQGGKYQEDNVVMLCPSCHTLVHTSKITYFPMLRALMKERYGYHYA